MMPDLGKYAEAVLSAYGISVLLLAGLIWLSLNQSARARNKLAEEEKRHRKNG
jgi:heme exporter protein D